MPDWPLLSTANLRRREKLPMRADAMQYHCTATYSINEQEVRSNVTLREAAPLRTTLAEPVLAEGWEASLPRLGGQRRIQGFRRRNPDGGEHFYNRA